MQAAASRSFTTAKLVVATAVGVAIGWYTFGTPKAAITGAVVGFILGWLWQ
jgi:hypothetical protein